MAPARAKDKKRCNAGDQEHADVEAPERKKKAPSGQDTGPVRGRMGGRKHEATIDLESGEQYAVSRQIIRRVDANGEPEGHFPRYDNGTVYIELIEGEDRYTYIFDKNVFMDRSDALSKLMELQPEEADRSLAINVRKQFRLEFFFTLTYSRKHGVWAISQAVSLCYLLSVDCCMIVC